MSWLDSPQLHLLEKIFGYFVNAAKRWSAANLANIDTPGYHARDVDFRGELARAVSGQDSGLTSPLVMPVPGLVERPRRK